MSRAVRALLAVLALVAALLFPSVVNAPPAQAGVGIGTSVDLPSPLDVGSGPHAGTIRFTNTSDGDDNNDLVEISDVQIFTGEIATPGSVNADVFDLDTAADEDTDASISCDDDVNTTTNYTLTETSAGSGVWDLEPVGGSLANASTADVDVILQSTQNSGVCLINFTFDVESFPDNDDSGQDGTQARLRVFGDAFNPTEFNEGTASGSDTVTVQADTTTDTVSSEQGTVAPGTSVTDTATVTGVLGGPAPTGNVSFFLCQPSEVTANGGDCSANGTQVGGPVALGAGDGQDPPSASATSAPTTNTTAEGKYCWRAEYAGDTPTGPYHASEHTNSTTECFTVELPDLTPNKENDVGGATTLEDGWNWTITLSNLSTVSPATFADGETILTDNLPNATVTYGAPSVGNVVGTVTGQTNIACSIDATPTLTCTANGGDVTIGASSSFDVVFSADASVVGTYNNPDGICRVDPNNDIDESNENNNDCQDAVVVAAGGAVLLIIDEDSIDNGIHFSREVNGVVPPITPDGPLFFDKIVCSESGCDVNDDKPGKKQRDELRYWAANHGVTIRVRTGQTGDEGWFAPGCIPGKWLRGNSNRCLDAAPGGDFQEAIGNYFGVNGRRAIPKQSRLDKIPMVRPLRSLGLQALVGKDVCAVVYDSDISINYDFDKPLEVNGNLQGETLGIVAFHVVSTHQQDLFSSSTLPDVTITILDPETTCTNFQIFQAPIPPTSSEPNDRFVPPRPEDVAQYVGNVPPFFQP